MPNIHCFYPPPSPTVIFSRYSPFVLQCTCDIRPISGRPIVVRVLPNPRLFGLHHISLGLYNRLDNSGRAHSLSRREPTTRTGSFTGRCLLLICSPVLHAGRDRGFHVKAASTLCKETDNISDQSRRRAAVSSPFPARHEAPIGWNLWRTYLWTNGRKARGGAKGGV